MVRPGQEAIAVLILSCVLAGCSNRSTAFPAFHDVQGDEIAQPLTATPGDAARGREIVAGRDANCLFCHAIPGTGERFMGNIGPPLAGVGMRLAAGQLRLRIVDPARLNRDAVMPAYYKTEGLDRVALAYRGKPILNAQQVEDVIAYLVTLK
jgi:sulfur-oxidizing protein SoxX